MIPVRAPMRSLRDERYHASALSCTPISAASQRSARERARPAAACRQPSTPGSDRAIDLRGELPELVCRRVESHTPQGLEFWSDC